MLTQTGPGGQPPFGSCVCWKCVLEYLDRGDVAFGLLLEIDEDAVDMGGGVVDVVIQPRVVEQQTQ